MRADARANRERILAAAEVVFGEKGAHASTEEVAQRAGVGIATVFRHYPTKTDLVEATLIRHFDQITAHAAELAGATDAGPALARLVSVMVETGATKVTLANLLTESGDLPVRAQAASRALHDAVDVVLRRAQQTGEARPDVTVDELYFVVRGLAQAAASHAVDVRTLRGAVSMVLAGLMPAGTAAAARGDAP
jgi:AcrR family transcriptional regulator